MDELSRERLGLARVVAERPVNRWGDTAAQIRERQAALRRLWKEPKSAGVSEQAERRGVSEEPDGVAA